MRRRLFNILSALSLLPCVVTIGLWILSIWVGMEWRYFNGSGNLYVVSVHGCIEVIHTTQFVNIGPPTEFHECSPWSFGTFGWNHLGFDVHLPTTARGVLWFAIPDWFVCSTTAVLPCLWFRSYRRGRLAERKGLCLKCGYDLRATPDRCPECATAVIVTEAKA